MTEALAQVARVAPVGQGDWAVQPAPRGRRAPACRLQWRVAPGRVPDAGQFFLLPVWGAAQVAVGSVGEAWVLAAAVPEALVGRAAPGAAVR